MLYSSVYTIDSGEFDGLRKVSIPSLSLSIPHVPDLCCPPRLVLLSAESTFDSPLTVLSSASLAVLLQHSLDLTTLALPACS